MQVGLSGLSKIKKPAGAGSITETKIITIRLRHSPVLHLPL